MSRAAAKLTSESWSAASASRDDTMPRAHVEETTNPAAPASMTAKALQEDLERRLSDIVEPPRWSARRSAAFIILASAVLWTLIAVGTMSVFRALAG